MSVTVDREINVTVMSAGGRPTNLSAAVTLPETLSILPDGVQRKQNQHLFRILTQKDGDKRVVWDSTSFQEIRDAKSMFDDLVGKGLVPYRVGEQGENTNEPMVEFDPAAEEIIFLPIPALVGG